MQLSDTTGQHRLRSKLEPFGPNDLDPEALNQVRQANLQAEFFYWVSHQI